MNSPTPLREAAPATPRRRTIDIVNASLKRRYAREARFRFIGASAVFLGLLFVVILFGDIVAKGYTAFQQTYIQVPVYFDPEVLDPDGRQTPRSWPTRTTWAWSRRRCASCSRT